jgi:acetyltransferase-like isoleucine patch superfamily enzyme
MKPAMTPQQAFLSGEKNSALAVYRELAVGQASLPFFLWYEAVSCLSANLPGLPGFALRSLLYPTLLGASGARPAFGRGAVIRNPRRIFLGRRVMVDDYAVLDVRGVEGQLTLSDHVSIGRFTTVAAKGGVISIGAGANIGSYCRVATQSKVVIGESVLVAAYCYIGPGNHQSGDAATPLIAREMENRGGVNIGAHAWIGAHSTILDGVTIGAGAIVGAHSLVREDVPPGAVVAGVPARIIRRPEPVAL